MLPVVAHAIVSADGMIADADGDVPEGLRNDADWRHYQQALDQSALVVVGRRGHERFPNPGRRRLVVTHGVTDMGNDPRDQLATLWNPAGRPFAEALAALGVRTGTIAIAGLFDLFLPHLTAFALSEVHGVVLPGGRPCFSGGHPRSVLAEAGFEPMAPAILDNNPLVTHTRWQRLRDLDSAEPNG